MATTGAAPMQVLPLVELGQLGIPAGSMAFTHVTMQSEKYLCVRETGAANNVVIVETANPSNPMRRPITADSAILAHSSKVIALKAFTAETGDSLQVFNLDTKTKLKAFTNAERAVHWTWLSDSTIAFITDTSVFHWEMSGDAAPQKKFDRNPSLNGSQIISYKVSADGKWCTLIGIAPGVPERPQLVKGLMQLYSVEQNRSQPLEAHSAAFSTMQIGGVATPVIAFTSKLIKDGEVASKIHVIALGGSHKKQAELFFPEGFADDFPVSLLTDEKFGFVYVITKMGLLFVYDLENLTAIYRNRISADPVFLAQSAPTAGGFFAVNRRGTVLHVTVNPGTIVPFVANQLKNVELAIKIASRGNLPGADTLFVQQFETQYAAGQHKEAAETAANSPQGVLRTQKTLDRLQQAPTQPGQKSPLLVYFGILLQKGQLNAAESTNIAKLVLSQGKPQLLQGWIRDNKVTASEELGDLLKDQMGDPALALQMYKACGASKKEVLCHAETGDIASLIAAAGQAPGQKPDYMFLLQSLMMSNPAGAVGLAKGIVKQPGPPIDKATIANLFLQRQMYQEATAFLLDALEADLPEDAPLQTKLIEVNLMVKPDVADAILSNGTFSHYDRPRIAQLCEKAGLYMRALQHYTDLTDIKRVIVNTHAIDPQALLEYFGSLSSEWGLECLSELLHTNPTLNTPIVTNIAKEYTDAMGVSKIIALFEEHNSMQGLFMYLGSRIATSEDPDEHYTYIVAAAKVNQMREVERMTRESNFLPAEKVKAFLMDAKLPDARPLINVCDRFDMVVDLTTYLYTNNMIRYIEGYVQKVNPAAAPQVVGGLLDCQAADDFISNLIMSVRSLLPVAALCEQVEKRNRLKLLTPFLELLVGEGSTDPEVHNAMGKILIDTNNNPEHFLQQNPYYDPIVVGKYCEKRDPHLACVAFRRGECDDALLECTNTNSLFKLQSRYIVERQNMDLYAKVLAPENKHRRAVIDQLVSTALPESKHPDLVACCVRAFLVAKLEIELLELLEKIVLQNSAFSSNVNLQNLLITTAIKSDPSRVMDYIRRLDAFEAMAVADVALENGQFDAAFEIYRKSGKSVDAVTVLLERCDDVTRAHEFATKIDSPTVWSVLAKAQLKRGLVSDAIGSYLLAKDSSDYAEVIKRANEMQQYSELTKYLLMVRKKVKDPAVDNALVIAYAKTAQKGELEHFITGTHQANLQVCGELCLKDGLYEPARVIFGHIPNYGRLATCLVHLERFQEAVDAARKANSPLTWKEVCFACVEVKEFKLAQLCALNIIVATDSLDEVSELYQSRGFFSELIALLESGIGLERAHMGIFSELGMMYAYHAPEKLMEHLKLFGTKLNIPRLIRICEEQQLYEALTFLYIKYDEHENALNVMMSHSAASWEHVLFKDVAVKCSSAECLYKAISFYVEQHPELFTDMVKVLEARVDHTRVVEILRRGKHLPLAKDYLEAVQKNNLPAVNEAYNELLIDEEDFAGLRTSIEHFDNFDQLQMAGKLEDHELTEFRRIAGFIYKRNLKWRKAMEMAKKDELFKDATEIAAQSGDSDLAEDLLRFFCTSGHPESFVAALYTCNDLVKPDVVLELAWLNGLTDLAMPYFISWVKEVSSTQAMLVNAHKDSLAAAHGAADNAAAQEAQRNAYAQLMPLALPAPPSANMAPPPQYTGAYM